MRRVSLLFYSAPAHCGAFCRARSAVLNLPDDDPAVAEVDRQFPELFIPTIRRPARRSAGAFVI